MITINTQQIAEEIADALLEGHKHCEVYAPDDAALIKEYLDGYFKEGMMAVRMDAIDEFADYLRMSYDKGMRLSVAMCKNEIERYKLKALYSRFIDAIDDCVKAFDEKEQTNE